MAGATTSAGRHAISSAVNADATVTAAAIAVMLGFFVWEFHQFHHRELRRPAVRETIAIQALARDVQAVAGAAFPLTYVADSPFAMQLALNTMRPPVSVDEAAALLRGDAAAFVVTAHPPKLVRALGTGPARARRRTRDRRRRPVPLPGEQPAGARDLRPHRDARGSAGRDAVGRPSGPDLGQRARPAARTGRGRRRDRERLDISDAGCTYRAFRRGRRRAALQRDEPRERIALLL